MWLVNALLIPLCLVLGAKRALSGHLHRDIAVFSVLPIVRMYFAVQVHDDFTRRYLSLALFVALYFALSYAGAWCFDRLRQRDMSDT